MATRLDKYRPLLESLIKPERIEWLNEGDEAPVSALQVVGDLQVLVPMSDLIDKQAEITRLNKEIGRRQNDISRADGKLKNPNFIRKAPAEIVQKERHKFDDLVSALDQLEEQKKRVESL